MERYVLMNLLWTSMARPASGTSKEAHPSPSNRTLGFYSVICSSIWPTNRQKRASINPYAIGEVRAVILSRAVESILTVRIENSVPPALLATLIAAQHMRPFQPLPMMFPPVLLFSSYLNLSDFKTDAAGITAAWSGLYGLLAMRRKQVSPPLHDSPSSPMCSIRPIRMSDD
jgi:hypothetical protein